MRGRELRKREHRSASHAEQRGEEGTLELGTHASRAGATQCVAAVRAHNVQHGRVDAELRHRGEEGEGLVPCDVAKIRRHEWRAECVQPSQRRAPGGQRPNLCARRPGELLAVRHRLRQRHEIEVGGSALGPPVAEYTLLAPSVVVNHWRRHIARLRVKDKVRRANIIADV